MILPLSIILGFCLYNLATPLTPFGLMREVMLVAGTTALNQPFLRLLFWLSESSEGETA